MCSDHLNGLDTPTTKTKKGPIEFSKRNSEMKFLVIKFVSTYFRSHHDKKFSEITTLKHDVPT